MICFIVHERSDAAGPVPRIRGVFDERKDAEQRVLEYSQECAAQFNTARDAAYKRGDGFGPRRKAEEFGQRFYIEEAPKG